MNSRSFRQWKRMGMPCAKLSLELLCKVSTGCQKCSALTCIIVDLLCQFTQTWQWVLWWN